MPRPPRLHAPGAIYHVTARGNHRQDIFFKKSDRQALDDIMANALDHTGARVHAYCWMTNHTHMLVQVADRPLGVLMQRVGTRFARFIQKGIPTTGHLFENRYHSLLVDVDSYFLTLLRYIHLNPVRAGIVDSPDQYRWSSHRVYLGKVEQSWVHIDFALSFFGPDLGIARDRYRAFVHDSTANQVHKNDLRGNTREPRVLGDDRFLENLSIPTVRRFSSTTLDQVINEICVRFQTTEQELRSPCHSHRLAKARAFIAARAAEEQLATYSDIARRFNRSVSALTRAVTRYTR